MIPPADRRQIAGQRRLARARNPADDQRERAAGAPRESVAEADQLTRLGLRTAALRITGFELQRARHATFDRTQAR